MAGYCNLLLAVSGLIGGNIATKDNNLKGGGVIRKVAVVSMKM